MLDFNGRVLFITPEKRAKHFQAHEQAMAWAEKHTESNVYFSCALMRPPHFGRGGVADTTGITMLWLDLDIADDAHAAGNCPTEAQANQILEAYPVKPSVIVHSGHGWHCYWILDSPFMWADEGADHATERRQRAADLMRGWQSIAQTAAAAMGCHVDSTFDLARVLRVPGTWNVKNGGRLPVAIIEENGNRYSLDALEAATPKVAAPTPAARRSGGKCEPVAWDDNDDFESFIAEIWEVVTA